MDPELSGALDQLRRHFDDRLTRMERHVDRTAAESREHSEQVAAETRRHFEVVAERLDSKVELVAEHVVALSGRIDQLETDLRQEILTAQRELSSMIRFSYAELDRKIQTLESRVGDMETRLLRLEADRA